MPRISGKKVTMSGTEGEGNCLGFAAREEGGKLSPWKFNRRAPKDNDVSIDVKYCGVCHSDIHQVANEWGSSTFPMVPGHEMIGVVTAVGKNVTKFKVGDYGAIGCMVDSCGECDRCKNDEENYCPKCILTYNGKDADGNATQGGYSTNIVCQEKFVLRIAPKIFVPAAAPLLCAGITVWSPMKYYEADKPGMRVAVVGLGGLGHMAVKFAKQFGQHVTVISRSYKKKEDAMASLGADDFIATSDEEAVKAAAERFDAVIDTVAAQHDIQQILSMIKVDGKLMLVGVPEKPYQVHASGLVMRRKMIGGSLIGGIKETQEMLDYCAEHNITCDIEEIAASEVNEAYERVVKGDVKYRFVINVKDSLVDDTK